MKIKNILLALGITLMGVSCTTLNDCECSVMNEKNDVVSTYEEDYYDGSCSELNERYVSCKTKGSSH